MDVVTRSSQGAEGVLKKYEDKLRDVQTVPNDVKEVETCRAELKVTNMAWLSAYFISIYIYIFIMWELNGWSSFI